MFLVERFTHKCSLIKRSLIRFADRPVPKTLDIFYCESTANDVCIFFMRFERIIHSVWADFAPRKLLIVRHYTMPYAHYSKRRACVRVKQLRMRDEDLTAICDRTKGKTKLEFQIGRFLWKTRVITRTATMPLKVVTFPGFRRGGSVQEDLKAYERVRMCIKCVAYKDCVPLTVTMFSN